MAVNNFSRNISDEDLEKINKFTRKPLNSDGVAIFEVTLCDNIAAKCPYAEDFAKFDHSSGMNLPLYDEWANNKALQLLKWSGKI